MRKLVRGRSNSRLCRPFCRDALASRAEADCAYQKVAILATWTNEASQTRTDKTIGYVWFAHLSDWQYNPGDVIDTLAEGMTTRANPNGSGTIYYIPGVNFGKLQNVTHCGGGAHVHMEFFSRHDYGRIYEYHSNVFFDTSSCDGWGANADHIHCSNTGYTTESGGDKTYDPSDGSQRRLGLVGGSSYSYHVADDPFIGDH